jgi:hypothetical protein
MPDPGQHCFAITEEGSIVIGLISGWTVRRRGALSPVGPDYLVDVEITDQVEGDRRTITVDRESIYGSGHAAADALAARVLTLPSAT